jgi:Na+-translocating ferredoxin:NAD+ oxidoreductase RnfD subunit
VDQIIAELLAAMPTLVTQVFLVVFGTLITGAVAFGISLIRAKVTDKKKSALLAASAMLAALGINVSADALDAAIEAAVMEAFNYDDEAGDTKQTFQLKRLDGTVEPF